MDEAKKELFWLDEEPAVVPAWQFNRGNSAQATVGSPDGKSEISFGGWVKLLEKSDVADSWYCCFGWNQSAGWGTTAIWGHGFRFGSGSSATNISFSALPEKTWIHVIASWDGSQAKLFLNGQLHASKSVVGYALTGNDSTFRLASITDGTLKRSSIAACNVFVLDRAIASTEDAQSIMHMKTMKKLKSDASIVEAWTMNELVDGKFAGVMKRFDLQVNGAATKVEGPLV